MSGVRAKICGLTRPCDVLTACQAGAAYLGFIFAPSPRRLEPEAAARLVAGLPTAGSPERVGVFVNESAERIRAVAAQAGLTMVQLAGDESPAAFATLGLPVLKVIRLRSGEPLDAVLERAALWERILLEPHVEGMRGGTGRPADWSLARAVVDGLPGRQVFLAGGLTPGNVAGAVAAVRPFAVDASSGLETAPGIKDPSAIRHFMEAVQSA